MPGDGDVHARQGRGQRCVALVGYDDHRAGLRDEEVAAGDPHVGSQIMLAQHAPGLEAQLVDFGLTRRGVCLGEQVGDFLLALVQRRADDMRGRFVVVDLQDVFAQIGLDDLEAGRLDRAVERRFLAHHRFRLDDLGDAVSPRDVEYVRVDVGRGLRPEHGRAARRRVTLENLQPDIEVVERTLADRPARFARGFEIVELGQATRGAWRQTCP